jgi:hypothetical protein
MNTRRKIDRAIAIGVARSMRGPHPRRFLRTSLAIAGDFGKIGGLIRLYLLGAHAVRVWSPTRTKVTSAEALGFYSDTPIQRLIHLSIQLQRAFVLGFRAPNR